MPSTFRYLILFVGLIGLSHCSHTLLKFYLSPNCSDNYIGYVCRRDSNNWPDCYTEACYQLGSNYVTRECAPDSWSYTQEPPEFVTIHIGSPGDDNFCSGGDPVSIVGAIPNQCIIVPDPTPSNPGSQIVSACDPTTGAVTVRNSMYVEPTATCDGDFFSVAFYPTCQQIADHQGGFNDCPLPQAPKAPVAPVSAPVEVPVSPPVVLEPLTPLSASTPRADPVPISTPQQHVDVPHNYEPVQSPQADHSLSTLELGMLVVATLILGVVLGSVIACVINSKRKKRAQYDVIESVN